MWKHWKTVVAAAAAGMLLWAPPAVLAESDLEPLFRGTYEEAAARYPNSLRLSLSAMQAAREGGGRNRSVPPIERNVESQCSLLGETSDVTIPGFLYFVNGEVEVVAYDIGAMDCNGRCGAGCPPDGGIPTCTDAQGIFRYTTDCIVHDACVDRWGTFDLRCDAIFAPAADDCVESGIDCCQAYSFHGFTDPVANLCESDRCGPCSEGQGECGSDVECAEDLLCSDDTQTCQYEPSCGDPNGDGQVTAGDALWILRAAVGEVECEAAICDVVGDNGVKSSDSLWCLRRAVGEDVAFECPFPLSADTGRARASASGSQWNPRSDPR